MYREISNMSVIRIGEACPVVVKVEEWFEEGQVVVPMMMMMMMITLWLI